MTSLDTTAPTAELGRYVRAVIRRWRVVLVFALLGAVLAAAYLAARPTQATASALVSLNIISQDPFDTQREPSGLIDAQTEVQTARASAVVRRTADALGGITQAEVRSHLTAEHIPDATVIRITYTSDTVDRATAGADEAAQQFLAYRGEVAAARLDAIAQRLGDRRDLLRDDLQQVNQALSEAEPNSPERAQAVADRELLDLELSNLVTKINSVNSVDTTGGTMLTYASDVGAFLSPNKPMILITGVLAGLLLGMVAAFVREARDRRIRDVMDVRDAGGGLLLARLSGLQADESADAEALGSAWEQLSADATNGAMVIMITDVAPSAASSMVATDLAVALADADVAVTVELVISGMDATFTESLKRSLGLDEKTRSPDWSQNGSRRHKNLVVSIAQSAMVTKAVRDHLTRPDRSAPIRIVAVPATEGRSAVLGVARQSSAVVLVAIHETTRHRDLQALCKDLDGVHARVSGTVLTRRRHPSTEKPAALEPTEEQVAEDTEPVKT